MSRCALPLALALLGAAAARSADLPFERTEEREACAHHDPLRRPFYGDTHVHTTLSFDAWGTGTRNTPRDAYRYARGEPVGVQPYAADGRPLRTIRLRRPLDFAMVSDHAEMLGETSLCRTPGSSAYGAFTCVLLRRWPKLGYMMVNSQWSTQPGRLSGLCGEDGTACREASAGPWREIQEAAEAGYDRSSACRFTSFVGYEWSGSRVGMIHRNVVFRNAAVPPRPANAIDDLHRELRLWERLESECLQAGTGCDVLAIPHNSNVSGGSQFWTRSPDGGPLTAELARRRAALEPLVEITQHKGDSECRAGAADALCGFETLAFGDVAGHASALYRSPVPPGVYVREALIEGLSQQQQIGANPFKLGIIGASDNHLGTPGQVDEDDFVGNGAGTVSARLEVPPLPDHPLFNPGGLAGVWAEENSRDALFAAMRRRETFGTSGPRIELRFFGGWRYGPELCDARDFARRGYAGGVPMGGDLPPAPADAPHPAPRFAVWALRDPGPPDHPGTALQRIQIVKGWVEDGEPRERVFDVAGDASDRSKRSDRSNRADVDLATCTPTGAGFDQLCSVWRDPEFDPALPAVYYARVLENPSCRWTTHACNAAGVVCGESRPSGALAACCDPELPRTIQERAWSSPIWFTPAF